MAKKTTYKIGSLFVTEYEGRKLVSLGLGQTGKDPKYNLTVEVKIKDHTGAVVHEQTNGFINLVDPRTQPDELHAAGFITEDTYNKMKEQVTKIPEKIKYNLTVRV